MGRKLLIAAVIVLASKSLVESMKLTSRRFPSCGYMGGKVYCYGGITSVIKSDTADSSLYSLDIVQLRGQPNDVIDGKWEIVEPSAPFDTEFRRISNAIVMADGNRLLINGGFSENTKYVNQTIIYDVTTNSWTTSSAYTEGTRGVRQIYAASVVNLPDNRVGFYGGFERFADKSMPQITASGATMPIWDDGGTSVGFKDLQSYSPDNTGWFSLSPQTNLPANYYFQAQTATLDPVSGKVYFLGGTYTTPAIDDPKLASLHWIYTFNTKSGAWLNETLSGSVYPSERQYHTATLMPNSRDIMVYGGTGGDDETGKALVDYCFTLNLIDHTWTERSNLNVPGIVSGPRFSHSAVLINTTLLILYGKGSDGTLQPSMLSIDIADVANIAYSATYGSSANVPLQTNNNSNTQDTSSSQSKGIIGGIVAGAVVAVLAITAAIVYRIRSKKKAEQRKEREFQNQQTSEQIHVDWDTIDNHYREVSPVSWSATNSPQSANLTSSSKRESFSQRFSSTLYGNDASVVKPSFDTERGYPIVKPDAV